MNKDFKEMMVMHLLGQDMKSIINNKMKEKVIGKQILQKINKSKILLSKLKQTWEE